MGIHLVLGGARSGKSAYAEQAALSAAERMGAAPLYVATGVATDPEMAERIARHQKNRAGAFGLQERPVQLPDWLRTAGRGHPVLLIDCLGTYLGNELHAQGESATEDGLAELAAQLGSAAAAHPGAVFVVSNEVGAGIVPANPLARLYRDVLGRWNAQFAAVAQDVTLMVAGIPVALKRGGQSLAFAAQGGFPPTPGPSGGLS